MSAAAVTAVYGGSFDPPHLAHVLLALTVLETHPVDELLVVPTFKHAFDKRLAPYEQRLEMCRLAMAPLGSRVAISTVERDRDQGTGQPSRTLDTLEALAKAQPGRSWRLVIGADILHETHNWWRWSDIVRLAPPIVIGRQGVDVPPDVGPLVTLPAISSTEVRSRLAADQPVDHLVPRAVSAYVRQHGLYRS